MLNSASTRNRSPKHDLSQGQFERLLEIASQVALVLIGFFLSIVALQVAHGILVPIGLAIVVGLVFGPIADWLEQRGVAPALSGLVAVGMLIGVIALAASVLAVPLSDWIAKAPAIWAKLQAQMLNWKDSLETLGTLQNQLSTALGGGPAMEVTVQDGSRVLDIAMLAPSILGDMLIFLVSFYFYIATRDNIRVSILAMCVTRRMRWRTAHVFRDVEGKVSRFLLTVTFLNFCVGAAMTLITWGLGLPSPLLWGALAAVLNYVPYVGQGAMIVVLLAAGITSQPDTFHIALPVLCYLGVTFIESQIAFPQLVGRTMTLNPFLIFLSIVFWIWVWGPVGSLMAVPALIILTSVISNIMPLKEVKPRKPVRRTANMTNRDLVLANAARAIKEKAEEETQAVEAKVEAALVTATEAKAPRAARKRPPRKPVAAGSA